ncbi:LysR substrate-binding domain-containing protein [Dechloromonas sp. ZY10]|uniref:LysR family transcriptional regulator n=1 Tax=Dechloromonas aquae TaxID=2664436 RepID=UPI00352807D3
MADRRLQVFHAVARHLSFTRAAEALFMTQPAVTFQIRQLEEQYRARLFERRHGGISLTPAGELVLSYAERILALGDELEVRLAEMTDEMQGPLLLGASASIGEYMLPRLLGEFNALYPRVRVTLMVANSENLEQRVAERSVDLALVELAPRLPGVAGRSCRADELAMVCAPDHPLAGLATVRARELVDYEYVGRETGSATRQLIEHYFSEQGIAARGLKTLMELGSPEALKAAVAGGLGFAILSRLAVERECRLGELRAIALQPPLRRELYLIHPQERFQSRVVSSFIDFVVRQLHEAG